jgi:hypothetical protein
MTPPFDIEAACAGCFLNERTGGVCPMAIDAYHLEVLRTAVVEEAPTTTSFAELARQDAQALASRRQTLALPQGAQDTTINQSKEVEYVQAAGPVR